MPRPLANHNVRAVAGLQMANAESRGSRRYQIPANGYRGRLSGVNYGHTHPTRVPRNAQEAKCFGQHWGMGKGVHATLSGDVEETRLTYAPELTAVRSA